MDTVMARHETECRNIQNAAVFIRSKISVLPEIGIVLGSGLGPMAERCGAGVVLPYADIPGCPAATAPGHSGRLILAGLAGRRVMCMQGRFHFYEGHDMARVVFLIRVMAELGIRSLILTNAAGGVNRGFEPGDLMAITDHIGLQCVSPLIGPNFEAYGPRFNDQSAVYDRDYLDLARRQAAALNIPLREGVYYYTQGPAYETPAEVRAIGRLGGDAVGMSTVPEAICANHAGIRIFGMSCITNAAAGILDEPLNHEDVLTVGRAASARAVALVEAMLPHM